MSTAFVLGNGQSRKVVDPNNLRHYGPIYACNAIYREFTPDCLVATDKPIATAIQESGYALKNRFHTRKPIPNLGALSLHRAYHGFSSGPNAVGLAAIDGYARIFLLGFDLGTTNGQFNNVYANTEFYKKSIDPPTFSGNWIKQLIQICEEYPNREFVRVEGPETAYVPLFAKVKNLKTMDMTEFLDRINSKKGIL